MTFLRTFVSNYITMSKHSTDKDSKYVEGTDPHKPGKNPEEFSVIVGAIPLDPAIPEPEVPDPKAKTFQFEKALKSIRTGGIHVARTNWIPKGLSISIPPTQDGVTEQIVVLAKDRSFTYEPSQQDLLAEDWQIVG